MSAESWSVTIPGNPPALNETYQIVYVAGKPRLAKRSKVTVWQDAAAWTAKAARPRDWVAGRRVILWVYWYTARERDADAGLKALQDALAVGLGINDKVFLPRVLSNEIDKANPRTVVTLENA